MSEELKDLAVRCVLVLAVIGIVVLLWGAGLALIRYALLG